MFILSSQRGDHKWNWEEKNNSKVL